MSDADTRYFAMKTATRAIKKAVKFLGRIGGRVLIKSGKNVGRSFSKFYREKLRLYLVLNLFLLTRNFISYLDNPEWKLKKDYQKVMYLIQLFLAPILILILPVIDLSLLIFLPGLHLFKPLFKAGWKYGLISSIGVTLAVSVITQYVFFIYSYQYQAFELFLEEEPRRFIQIEVESIDITPSFHQYDTFDRIAEITLVTDNVSARIPQRDLFFRKATFTQVHDPINNVTLLPNLPLFGTHGKLRLYLSQNIAEGVEPFEDNETLVLMTRNFYNHSDIRVNSSINLYVPISLNKQDSITRPDAQTSVKVTGIVFIDDLDDYNVLEAEYGIPIQTILELEDEAAAISWWVQAATLLNDIDVTYGRGDIFEDLFYDVTLIDAFKIDNEINLLKYIGYELKQSYLTFEDYNSVRINSYLITLMENFKNEYGLYQTYMFAFLSPIIALTIILTVYAANLVRKKRDRQLTILADRGTKRIEIGSYLTLEALIVGIVSLAVGVLAGIPISSLLLKSSNYLAFNNTSVPLRLEISSVSVAIIGSICAIFLVQLFNTVTLLRKRSIEDYGKVEKSLPKFYKYFVDVILVILASSIWIIYTIPALSGFKFKTARFVGIPAIVVMLFGLILVAQRLLPYFAKLLIRFSSRLRMDIQSLSLREIFRYQKSYARSSIILCLSFSLVVTSIIVPSTFNKFNLEGAYYDLGADILIRNFPVDDHILIETIENLTQVAETSVVRFVNIRDPQGDLSFTYSILAIDPETYSKVAYFRDDFSKKSFEELLNVITYAEENNHSIVLGQEAELNALHVEVGEFRDITYWAYNESKRNEFGSPYFYTHVKVGINDTFSAWPVLVKELILTSVRASYFHFVSSMDFFYSLEVSPYDVIDYLYVDVKEGYDISDTAAIIQGFSGGIVKNVEDQLFVKPDSPRSSILYSAINSTLLMSFAINSIILALFASIQLIDKNKEIATMKAIGISTGQLMKYFTSIYVVILLFSTIFGLIVGYISSTMLMQILSINRAVPAVIMTFPVGQIAFVLSILIAASLAGATIPTLSSTKQEVGTELRQSA